ncbi:hypothetical protein TNCV_3180441 [Trichonephila clavipes]|uniref:Uncharacterized protein n=1 Tax=Trichonephila clavipes TaxID=2585209 RepID=A0A8X6RET7_TRICX|nr:hypothetical protein TNCV_3180441 [Trichonephila clavipes]
MIVKAIRYMRNDDIRNALLWLDIRTFQSIRASKHEHISAVISGVGITSTPSSKSINDGKYAKLIAVGGR